MGSQTMILVLFLVTSILGSRGFVSHPQTALPPNIGGMSSIMIAVVPSTQPRNPSDHASVKHTWPRTIAPIESLAPDGPVKAVPDLSPTLSPLAHVGKGMPDGVHVQAPFSVSPITSPHAPGQATTPINYPDHSSPLVSPTPHELKNPSNTTEAASPSHHDSHHVISPATQEVTKPVKVAHAPLTSLPSPSPMISHVPHEINKPLISRHAPMASHPLTSPIISPAPHQVKNNSSNTQAPIISSTQHEVKNNSNNTHAPMVSHSSFSPMTSHVPHEIYKSSNTTHAPLASRPLTSPIISPTAPHGIKKNPNNTQAPLISPTRHEAKNNSNNTHAPMVSHSSFSPMASHVPHEIYKFSNTTDAPLASRPLTSPIISPAAPHGIKNNPNNTQAPLISPTRHEAKNNTNDRHAPMTSHHSFSPTVSPISREFKNQSNITHAPLSSNLFPSPKISPPRDLENPSNNRHSPSTSHLAPSPLVSPMPHNIKYPPNTTHAPTTSHASPSPLISPSSYNTKSPSHTEHAPISSHPHPPSTRIISSPVSTPATSAHHNTTKDRVVKPAPAPFSVLPPSAYHPVEGPVISPPPSHPPVPSKDRRTRHAPPFHVNGPSLSPTQAPISSKKHDRTPASPPTMIPRQNISPASILSPSGSVSRMPWESSPKPSHPNSGPTHSPSHSSPASPRKQRAPSPQPIWVLPPPPPNSDCNGFTCSAPLTNTPPGSPCDCVLPIKVALRLGITLYTFFPLVSELAEEIAEGVFLRQSQVRIMGANAASEDPEKTDVFINLVPLGKYFDSTTALLVYEKFWHKQVSIHPLTFGGYDILYVFYPGLPPSPPTAPADINVNNGGYGNSNNARMIHPLGVDVSKRKEKRSGSVISIIVLSSAIALVLIVGAAWLLLLKRRNHARLPVSTSQTLLPTFAKSLVVAGAGPTTSGSRPTSTSASFSSSMTTYTGSAKTFGFAEMERATNKFNDARIIGEGGFGRVYQGTLEDGTMVAVKALKRDDQQGGREFLAEVEMLSRLHHRNLVKLIGICTEEIRCLVYELIPNGSVDSHLHGVNKETFPLDWGARLKIALGAARGLAYLHEDSSPCVIHRDFKSSNILLEHDFMPKVSDFGLARTAMDEGNEHISTRVMGTFGYVAPEYAMTGHLLVKSDVYSYGVVLLELLTGRKPVDMSRPPGQENLVTWARPLLTSIDGLETIVDPTLGADVPSDSVVKVAAIASMCVQPEVSNRPFMGEVVQALKLVCNESDEHRASRSCSQEDLPAQGPPETRVGLGLGLEAESALSMSEIFSTSARFTKEASETSRRHSSSGPLMTGRKGQFWQRVRGLSRGSMSDHGYALRFAMSSDRWS